MKVKVLNATYRGNTITGTFLTNGKVHNANYHQQGWKKVNIQKDGKSFMAFVAPDAYEFNQEVYDASVPVTPQPTPIAAAVAPQPAPVAFENAIEVVEVPTKINEYEKTSSYQPLFKIFKSGEFMPMMITGPSGNGKTISIIHAAAMAKKPLVRVQISPETDEDSLIGGLRLINGNTVFEKGPVIKAMEAGAILLIDEIDRGTNKIMCLQGIMEGSEFMIKRTGELIKPAPGFNIVATGNTKGSGSERGNYTAASIIDDAFIERFAGILEQGWPTLATETRILKNHLASYDYADTEENLLLVNRLTRWAKNIRKSYEAEAIDSEISTRRLCHILKLNSIIDNIDKSIKMACAKFDDETQEALSTVFSMITGNEIEEDDD